MFSNLESIKPIFIPIQKRSNLISLLRKIFNKIFFRFNVFYFYFPFKILKQIRKIKENDFLIYIGNSSQTCFVLSTICKKNKKTAFFWNPCATIASCENVIAKIRSCGFNIATFDYVDSKKYNLILANQFYRSIKKSSDINDFEIDFFFCGRNKGRKDILQDMQRSLSTIGSCKFIIPEKEDAMSYPDYIDEVKKTKVLCDVNQKNQSGLTLRVLESLFFSKKLITNNTFIEKYDFFNPNNILVYTSHTTRDDVQSFLMKPYEPVDDEILARYEVNNVFKNIVHVLAD